MGGKCAISLLHFEGCKGYIAGFAKGVVLKTRSVFLVHNMTAEATSRWILKAPRQSALKRHQRWAVFGLISLIGCSFALFVWLMFDAWVVLPFTGLELGAVGFAFWWWDQHADDFEAITLEGDALKVMRRYGRSSAQCELPAAWAQVNRELEPSGWGQRRRLVIACKGQRVTFGEFLNEAGVNESQRLLRERLKQAWR